MLPVQLDGALDLAADPVTLTAALVDIPSVSGDERIIADVIEAAMQKLPGFEVLREGDAVVARTALGLPTRVVLAGHIDTVPIADNVPSHQEGSLLYGCGSSDMKCGDAVMLHLAQAIAAGGQPWCDVTFVFYDHEEVDSAKNGLGRLVRMHPDWIAGDFAVVLEPTNGAIEAGCQGTLRAVVRAVGRRAHSARSWLGINAIHAAGQALARLDAYEPRIIEIDGCTFREGLNAVAITGGVAGNIIPDECTLTINFRFAPDRDEQDAIAHVRDIFAGFEVEIIDSAPGALPGLAAPGVARFIEAVGQPVAAKYGWTDVARFSALGVPAINFGPGDPALAHTREEHVETTAIVVAAKAMRRFLFTSQVL